MGPRCGRRVAGLALGHWPHGKEGLRKCVSKLHFIKHRWQNSTDALALWTDLAAAIWSERLTFRTFRGNGAGMMLTLSSWSWKVQIWWRGVATFPSFSGVLASMHLSERSKWTCHKWNRVHDEQAFFYFILRIVLSKQQQQLGRFGVTSIGRTWGGQGAWCACHDAPLWIWRSKPTSMGLTVP